MPGREECFAEVENVCDLKDAVFVLYGTKAAFLFKVIEKVIEN